jgi:creatinine amidohydrolase
MTSWLPDMTAPEVEASGIRPVLMPVGSLEQHGPHLPLDTDSAIAESFARALGDAVEALVAPGLGYGYRSHPSSGGGEIFRATTSLSGAGLCQATRDVLSAFARHGYRDLVLVNGHYENAAFLVEAATLVSEQYDVRVLSLNWWELVPADRLDEVFGGAFPGWEAEHAGIAETSLMMHFHPERVRADLISDRVAEILPPTYTVVPERAGLVDPSGVLRTAAGSSADIGRRIAEEVLSAGEQILRRELGGLER